jgi:hypothetical protein
LVRPLLTNRSSMQPAPQRPRSPVPPWGVSLTLDVLELQRSHDPNKTYGFVGVGVSLKDLSSSIWMWYREDGGKDSKWAVRKVIEIPAEPTDPEKLQPLLGRDVCSSGMLETPLHSAGYPTQSKTNRAWEFRETMLSASRW